MINVEKRWMKNLDERLIDLTSITFVLTLKEWDMKIKCLRCWKEIEKKGRREICIKCANKRDHENSKKYREEYRQMKKEAWL